jgi:hypothetical protein
MATVVIRHKVGDINAWITGHQERLNIFAPAITGYKAFQDVNDPNSVELVIETTNLELLGTIVNDPKNKALKEKHSVIEPIILSTEIKF